ncbi:TetR/AcrR family transcriptional regulator C-terminal domain-containing protein [Leucobacter sp. cx-42]|nr:TetR/AcrR family transcriptional regulator C-terminal domain-containing protein [Leucobacter sp. cx-42]
MAAARSTSRRVGRPKTPVLSRELICETALHLLDTKGENGASMRDIADELGVRPSALYNHVRGRDDIFDGVRELVVARIDVSCFADRPWEEALVIWADSYRGAFVAHPPTVTLFATRPIAPDAQTSHMYEVVVGALVDAGWPRERVLSIIVAIENFLIGSTLDALAAPNMMDPGEREDVPKFSAAYSARDVMLDDMPGVSPADDAYRLGLDALLAGLRLEFDRM